MELCGVGFHVIPFFQDKAEVEAERSEVPRPEGCGNEAGTARGAKVAQGARRSDHYSTDDFESSDELPSTPLRGHLLADSLT